MERKSGKKEPLHLLSESKSLHLTSESGSKNFFVKFPSNKRLHVKVKLAPFSNRRRTEIGCEGVIMIIAF